MKTYNCSLILVVLMLSLSCSNGEEAKLREDVNKENLISTNNIGSRPIKRGTKRVARVDTVAQSNYSRRGVKQVAYVDAGAHSRSAKRGIKRVAHVDTAVQSNSNKRGAKQLAYVDSGTRSRSTISNNIKHEKRNDKSVKSHSNVRKSTLIAQANMLKERKKIIENAHETIVYITAQKSRGNITAVDYNLVVNNILAYEQKGIIAKYWPMIAILLLLVGILALLYKFTNDGIDVGMMKRPITKLQCYVVLLLTGWLGGLYLYLNRMRWLAWFSMILIVIFPILNYREIMYYYNIPSLLFIHGFDYISMSKFGLLYVSEAFIIGVCLINILIGIVCIPFWVYQFNGLYFRQHIDNDAILDGDSLNVDYFYNVEFRQNQANISKIARRVSAVLKNKNAIKEDVSDSEISGFFKSIFTGGKSDVLKEKVQRYRALQECYKVLREGIEEVQLNNKELSYYLNYYRIAAYRNLYLAKELIGEIKDKVSSQQQKLIVDEFPELIIPDSNLPNNVVFNSERTAFDSDSFFKSINVSLDNLSKIDIMPNENGEISKAALVGQGMIAVAGTLFSAIDGIISMNSRTSEAILEYEKNISKLVDCIGSGLRDVNRCQRVAARMAEIMSALSMSNKAFVMAYEPLRSEIFKYPSFKSFLFGIKREQEYLESEGFRESLHHLILVCTEYNKINKAKVDSTTSN